MRQSHRGWIQWVSYYHPLCAEIGELKDSARNAVAALQKRLSHRNPNVQLYALEVSCRSLEVPAADSKAGKHPSSELWETNDGRTSIAELDSSA